VFHRGESDLRSACGTHREGGCARVEASGPPQLSRYKPQSWDTSEVDFEGQGSMEVLDIEIEIG